MTNSSNVMSIAEKAHDANVDKICERIRNSCGNIIENVIQMGRDLIELKATVGHGEWNDLVTNKTPLSPEKAKKFMFIARNPFMANGERAHVLPAKWTILADLAKLDGNQLQQGIDRGLIHQSMDRKAARTLISDLRGTTTKIVTGTDAEAAPPVKVTTAERRVEKKQKAIDLEYCHRITFVVGAICGVSPDQILADSRHSAPSALARQLVSYVLCTSSNWSTARAAEALNRDRTTIQHGRDLIFDLRAEYEDVDQWVEDACVLVVETLKLSNNTPEAIQVRGIAA